jgi:hypothetical protein
MSFTLYVTSPIGVAVTSLWIAWVKIVPKMIELHVLELSFNIANVELIFQECQNLRLDCQFDVINVLMRDSSKERNQRVLRLLFESLLDLHL